MIFQFEKSKFSQTLFINLLSELGENYDFFVLEA